MACCCVVTQSGSVKVIESCGKFHHVAKPGCELLIPCVHNVSGMVSTKLQQLEVRCETKTKDNVFVNIACAIQFQVARGDGDSNPGDADVEAAHYRLTNARVQIESYVYDVVRAEVPKIELDNVFIMKKDIATAIQSSLKSKMRDFGYEILSTPITEVDPDKDVKRSMNEINKMKRLRVAAEDEGEAVKIRAVKEAEAEAGRTEIQAKADAEAKFLAGQGISRQRQAIMEGLRESVNAFKNEVRGVNAKTVMDLMIVTQYFDMMKDVGGQNKTTAVFLNGSNADGAKGMMAAISQATKFNEMAR